MRKMLLISALTAALAGCAYQGNPAMTQAGLAILGASSPPTQNPRVTNCRQVGAGVTCMDY